MVELENSEKKEVSDVKMMSNLNHLNTILTL